MVQPMTDESNYLSDLAPWSKTKAVELGIIEGLDIENQHFEILVTARNFYSIYGFSPSMRPLCKTVTEHLGVNKGRSMYLNQLFPGSPAKIVAKLAGLPKPKNCI